MPGRIRTVNVRKSLDTSGIAAAVRGRSSAGRARKSYCSGDSRMLRHDVVRVQVGDLRRVEAGFRGVEGPAEGALALGCARGRQAGRGGRRERRGAAPALQETAPRSLHACLRLLRGVDVDVLPPGVPVRRPAIAVQPRRARGRCGSGARGTCRACRRRMMLQRLVEQREPLGAVGHHLHPGVERVEALRRGSAPGSGRPCGSSAPPSKVGWPSGAADDSPMLHIISLPARAFFMFSGHFAGRNSTRRPSAFMSARRSSSSCRLTWVGSVAHASVSGVPSGASRQPSPSRSM